MFAVSKTTVFNKFRVEVFDKSVGLLSKWVSVEDQVLAGPVDLTIEKMVAGTATNLGREKEKMQICVNSFETL